MNFLLTLVFSLIVSTQTCLAADPAAINDASKAKANPVVIIDTNKGAIKVELYADKAPKTVENFLRYVREQQYDSTLFHRVIPGFMIQGGGYDSQYSKRSTHEPVENEADNGLKNVVGSIAMARTRHPHSATSQFFINVANNDFLDFTSKTLEGYGYTVFGQVVSGMDIVMAISSSPTGARGPFHKDAPLQPIVIEQVRLLE